MFSSVKENAREVRRELNSVIQTLNLTAQELRGNFVGIGSEDCAEVLEEMARNYQKALKRLDEIDALREPTGNFGGGGTRGRF